MAKQITELNAAGAVDSANDLLWLEQGGLPTKISPDDLGIGGGGGITDGTVTNSMLRWSGTAWVEEVTVRALADELAVGDFSGTLGTYTRIGETNGVSVHVGTGSGGWARGMVPVTKSGGLRLGGTGYLGSAESLTSWHVGFGSDWWSTGSKMSVNAAGLVTIDPGATGQGLQVDGGGVGVDIASFRRDQGGGADTEVSIHGASGYPTIRFDRDLTTAEWAIGVANNDSFVIANDVNLATAANWRLEVLNARMEFNSRANASSVIRIGEVSTLRGDTQDAVLQLYGEQTGVIRAASITNSGSNLQFSVTSGLDVQWLGDGAWTMDVRDGCNFRLRDSTDVDYVNFLHNGTDFVATYVGTAWHRFNGLTAGVLFRDGADIRIYGSSNVNYTSIRHDNTNGVIFTNSGDLVLDPAGLDVLIAGELFVGTAAGATQTTRSILDVTGGFGSIQVAGSTGGFEGYNIAGRMAFMMNTTAERGGIYDDVNNRWVLQWNALNAASNERLGLYAGATEECLTTVHTVADKLSGLDIKDANGTFRSAGFATMVQVSFAANTVVTKEHWAQKAMVQTGATTRTLTFNTLTTVPDGAVIWVKAEGGDVTLVDGTMVLSFYDGSGAPATGNRTLARGGWATIHKTGDSTADVTGVGLS